MDARKSRSAARLAWATPGLMLGSVLLALFVVRGGSDALLGLVGAALLLVPIGWVTISALWPARADRTCPGCGSGALRRLDPEATHGLECTACGWRDESASSWLLAEEEGPLEDIVLRQRGRERADSIVDRPPVAD